LRATLWPCATIVGGCSLIILLDRRRCDLAATLRTKQLENAQMFVWSHSIAGLRPPHNIRMSCCDTCARCVITGSLAARACYHAIQAWRIATVAATDSRVITLGSDIVSSRSTPRS
jgi:hypothetical protein